MKQGMFSPLKLPFVPSCLILIASCMYPQTANSQSGAAAVNSATSSNPAAATSAPKAQGSAPNPAPNLVAPATPTQATTPTPITDFEANVTDVEVRDLKNPKHPKEVALGSFVILTLDKPWATILKQQTTPTNKLGLFINDLFMKGLEPRPIPGQPNLVMFQLKVNDDNSEAWSVLFGHKRFGLRDSKKDDCADDEKIRFTVGLQDASWGAKNPQPLCLEYLPDWRAKLVLVISFVVAVLTIVLGVKSSMLRDSGDPRHDKKPGTYSLGRFQMAVWFVTVVFAYLFTYAVTGDTSPIPQGTLILMGIGAGTALGAAAIDLNKRTASKADLINWTAEKASLPQQIQDLQSKIANAPGGDPNLAVLQQQLQTAQQRLLAVSAQLAVIPSTEVAASEGFIRDLLSDANGISFHRLQVFGWVLVFWAVFVSTLFKKITMTDFDTTQLALMGISGSTYLGFKLQEKQS